MECYTELDILLREIEQKVKSVLRWKIHVMSTGINIVYNVKNFSAKLNL